MTVGKNNSKIEDYAGLFPKEIRLAVNSLSSEDESTFAIIAVLIENGQSLEAQELADELDTDVETVNNITDDLERGGIVEKKAGKQIGDPSSGCYELTIFGDRILNCLYEASTPDREKSYSSTTNQSTE